MCTHSSRDVHFMREALTLARRAADSAEVPVGAVVVLDGEIVGRGYNQPRSSLNPVAHAEVLALQDAAQTLTNYRLPETELYVTIEPCMMCTGAMVHARVARLIYGAAEQKSGAVHSHGLINQSWLNHQIEICGGVLEDECATLMSGFFAQRRKQ